jgi:hypothetical protein
MLAGNLPQHWDSECQISYVGLLSCILDFILFFHWCFALKKVHASVSTHECVSSNVLQVMQQCLKRCHLALVELGKEGIWAPRDVPAPACVRARARVHAWVCVFPRIVSFY